MTEWKFLKQIIDQKAIYPQFTEDTDSYFVKLYDNIVLIDECVINKNLNLEDKEDFELNYKPNSNKPIFQNMVLTDGAETNTIKANQFDTDGAQIVRIKAAKKGWSFWALPIEITTSTIGGSLYSKDSLGVDVPGISCKIYNNNDEEITTPGLANANLATCVKTVIDFEPTFDYELIGGALRINSNPAEDIRMWIVGAPDIPAIYGGSKEFASGINLKFLAPDSSFDIDGRVSKYIQYNATTHQGKVRIILKHPSGSTVNMQFILHSYRL